MKISELLKQGQKINIVNQPQVQQSQQQGFVSNIQQDLEKRRQNFQAGFAEQSQGKQTPFESGLQLLGQSAGFVFDIGGEAIKSVIDKIPDAIKNPAVELGKSVLSSPLGQTGIKAISMGENAYKDWKSVNPRAARDLESVINIATLLPVGGAAKTVGKEALSITGELAGKGANVLEKGLAEQGLKDTLEIIKPVLSIGEKKQALAGGRGAVSNKILPRVYETTKIAPSPRELQIAETVKDVVNKSRNPVDNISSIRDKIGELANQVDTGLESNNAIFNKNEIKAVLDKAKESSRVVFGSDASLNNAYSAVSDEMIRQIEKQPKTLSGLNQARREFDSVIKEKFPKLFDSPIGDSARQNAVLDVRRAVSNYIEKSLPQDNQFKQLLKSQNLMYDAIDNISQKAAKVVDLSATQKAMRALRQNPLVAGVTGGILTYGALTGMLSNPVVIGTLALGGAIKVGKTIVTSQILRQSLISVLRGLEKAGKIADGNAIREFIAKNLPIKK